MRNGWSGLGLLLVVPWLAGCVSGPQVRLEMGQGAPIVYTLPAAEPPPVEVRQEEFVSAMTELVLHRPLSLELPRREGRVVRASWWGASARDTAQQLLESQCAPTEGPEGCLVLPENAPPPEVLGRLRLALSYAMDTVWAGAAVPLSEYLDPLTFKVMVYTALCTYLVMLLMPVPEPVTKGIAAVLTLYLVVYLGLGPMREMMTAGRRLLEEAERATTSRELKEAGQRFGRVLGDSGMRVLLLMATAALGGQGGLVAKGPKLPGFGKAAMLSGVRTGVKLEAAGQVGTVVLGARELVVVLAPTAVAATALGPGSGDNAPGRAASNPQMGRFDTEHTGPRAFDAAREAAKKHAGGDLGPRTQKMVDPETGTLIGERSVDLKRGWRLDHDHFNWWNWTGGKKGLGGKYGHEFFPPEQAGPHSKHINYAPWE
ncbi:hypothetical protein [Archangium sp.]|uniref:SitA5 family polymorphic toxin n=1 Tax=Archangium sp. TaxID=1872627 RepID=UPI002D293773|nr:hypothetical protein [Archangium sp.]HYO54671.1 hypothetical protein [Archangium sp.]